jgi:hypothetical protein
LHKIFCKLGRCWSRAKKTENDLNRERSIYSNPYVAMIAWSYTSPKCSFNNGSSSDQRKQGRSIDFNRV